MKYIFFILFILFVIILISCKSKLKQNEGEVKDKADAAEATSRAADAAGKCFKVCDITKTPDLRLKTNASDQPQVDGTVDSSTYFWKTYYVRSEPIRLTQNYMTPGSYTIRYGWDSGIIVNRVRLQCLVENIAPYGCNNDWVFYESQGTQVGANIFFDGLFEFETYELQENGRWKFLYTDFKKEFFPDNDIAIPYILEPFCYYDRAIQAQQGDFYNNYFRYPNHDGTYKTIIRFNPRIKGCRAVKETDYSNNEETVTLKIENSIVSIIKT